MLEYDFAVLGSIGTNCYVVKNTDNKEMIMIDTADDYEGAVRFIDKQSEGGYVLKAILLTHGHFDHMLAAKRLANRYSVKIYASSAEAKVLADPMLNLSASGHRGSEAILEDEYEALKDNQLIELGGIQLKCLLTPGHTEGGMCYYIEAMKSLFAGDTLFACSVGRTDLPTGSMGKLVTSIKYKLFELPGETLVYPGHGEGTSIRYEQKYNAYVR